MGQSPRPFRWAALLSAAALLIAGCAGDDKTDQNQQGSTEGKSGGVFRIGIVEPTAIDPYNSQESEGILVTKQLFVGLVRVNDETAELTPGVAESWSKNDACTEWTFNLRSGTTFSNGDPVNAEAFIRGMTRAAKQKAASDVAYHMAGIEGYEAIHGSGAENAPPAKAETFSGLSAPDDKTFKVKLSAPDCEFDKKTLQPVYSPVPASAGEADNKGFNDMPIGNGPFKMKEPWQHDQSITLVRNDTFFDTKALHRRGGHHAAADHRGARSRVQGRAVRPVRLRPYPAGAHSAGQGGVRAEGRLPPRTDQRHQLPAGQRREPAAQQGRRPQGDLAGDRP